MTDSQLIARIDRLEAKIDALLDGSARSDEQLHQGRERFVDIETRVRRLESGDPVSLRARMDIVEREVWTRQGIIALIASMIGAAIGVVGAAWTKATHPGP